VLVLDSDVVVLRPELIADAVAEQQRTGAALLGQEEDRELLPLNCLLLDPALVWRPRLAPFLDRGDPSEALQRSVRRAGLPLATFPFRHHSYVLHLGRGTLQALARKQDAGHPLHAWALEHQDHHFGGHPYGRQLHADFLALYAAEVAPGEARIESLVAACRRTDRLRIPAARPLPPIPELLRRAEEGTLAELYDPSDA
jgi:hypothetical protein